MADNLLLLTEVESANHRRVVVLAHNGHVAKTRTGITNADPMGRLLDEKLGAKYFAVGSVIGDGEFRAYRFDPATGRSEKPELLQLGAAPPDTVEATLASPEAFFLPLHSSAPEIWWNEPHPMRIIGASYAPAYGDKYLHPVRVGAAFDALIYLPHA
jgi:erythromycin esterase-like protein